MKFKLISFLIFAIHFIFSQSLYAEEQKGLIVHAAEIGIGKFHRYDNGVHPYTSDNIWLNYVLAEDAVNETPIVQENADQSVTIFFSNLEELLNEVLKISETKKMKVDVLNINAHGMPGAMWFPANEEVMNSLECADWKRSAAGEDKGNYDQYYSPISKIDIYQIRVFSRLPTMKFMAPCTTGTGEWKNILERNPSIKTAFADDAQLHLFSCVVGLGWAGRRFTSSLADILFEGDGAKVQAAMNFGLGDWSMPEGMGFWDYQNSEQLRRDNSVYPINRSDREIKQKGAIRMAMKVDGVWKTDIISDLDFMLGIKDDLVFSTVKTHRAYSIDPLDMPMTQEEIDQVKKRGLSIRIPGVRTKLDVRFH